MAKRRRTGSRSLRETLTSGGEETWLTRQTMMTMAPPDAKLRWLVAFIAEDLDARSAHDRAGLGADLSGLRAVSRPGEIWRAPLTMTAMPAALLRELQTAIHDGLHALLDGKEWALPPLRGAALRDSTIGRQGGRELQWFADEPAAILYGVAKLIREHGEPLMRCKRCRAPFFKVKRQEFCTPACAQAWRDEKKKGGR
jgi:hypothetical protein